MRQFKYSVLALGIKWNRRPRTYRTKGAEITLHCDFHAINARTGRHEGVTKKREDSAKIRIRATTLGDLLLTGCDQAPNKDALVFPTERKTYSQVTESTMLRARALRALGVKPGDHVGVLIPSSIEFSETMFALALCGAVSVLMNARYRAPELAYVAENANLTAIVTTDASSERAIRQVQSVPGSRPTPQTDHSAWRDCGPRLHYPC
jgi:non-ribosomal peptide synthetase component F